MIANNINGTIRVFNSIPKVFKLKPNSFRYDLKDTSVHYDDGFRELITPILGVNEYKTNIYFDSLNDVFTYNVETYTTEELLEIDISTEYTSYLNRQSRGYEIYMRLCGEFKVSKNNGEINQSDYEELVDTLEPVRNELITGQFITAKRKLTDIGNSIIGVDIYDRFMLTLDNEIAILY